MATALFLRHLLAMIPRLMNCNERKMCTDMPVYVNSDLPDSCLQLLVFCRSGEFAVASDLFRVGDLEIICQVWPHAAAAEQ
jgi:hypothetical protein